jgi:hypothetical protein
VEAELHAFLTSALDGKKCLRSRFDGFTSREKSPDIQWVGTWVLARDILDGMGKIKFPTVVGNTGLTFRCSKHHLAPLWLARTSGTVEYTWYSDIEYS